MRFATRTFLFSFVPFAILLTLSFWTIQKLVEVKVRDGLRESLRKTHASMSKVRRKSELQNSRFLRVIAENQSLKQGLQLLMTERTSPEARLTVEDQLREMCQSMGFDYLLASDADGGPLAGVMRIANEQVVSIDVAHVRPLPPQKGFWATGELAYQIASTPVNQGDENLGTLSVGEYFDFSEFSTPAVLARGGKVLKSSIPGVESHDIEIALAGCKEGAECEVRIGGEAYLSLPMNSIYFGEGYAFRSLQSVDSASRPVQALLQNVFFIAGLGALAVAMLLSVLSSRSIVRPIAGVVSHLRESAKTGLLPEFHTKVPPIQEIRELTDSFNRAAASIREAHDHLHQAYVEFVGSLASALDARDGYTAGHSHRVSELSVAVAKAMNVDEAELDNIRLGALLHDIGKIGIADAVLQKPGRLTKEEMALIQQHPTIGRKILEGVAGFQPYLPTVELHHENWDGSGYPRGLRGTATPLSARIVHVVDAYDAMTTNRPYRSGMTHHDAARILQHNAGIQFDETIVKAFLGLDEIERRRQFADQSVSQQVRSLANAVHVKDGAPSEATASQHFLKGDLSESREMLSSTQQFPIEKSLLNGNGSAETEEMLSASQQFPVRKT